MADRLTQLQDAVTQQAEHFFNSIGILQQFAPNSPFPGFEKLGGKPPSPPPQDDYPMIFAKLITRAAKDMDVLIDALPSEDSSTDLQVASLEKLQTENEEEAVKLEEIVNKGETYLKFIQMKLEEIATAQLKCQALEGN